MLVKGATDMWTYIIWKPDCELLETSRYAFLINTPAELLYQKPITYSTHKAIPLGGLCLEKYRVLSYDILCYTN